MSWLFYAYGNELELGKWQQCTCSVLLGKDIIMTVRFAVRKMGGTTRGMLCWLTLACQECFSMFQYT